MNNQNKKPIWITIPEKNITTPEKGSLSIDKVKNKIFWGAGFVALAFFSFILIMPAKFSELIQGDLFDGEFQVVPDIQDQPGGAFFGTAGSGSSTTEESTPSEPKTPALVEATDANADTSAESDAVTVQVNPAPTNSNNTATEESVTETTETQTSNTPEAPEEEVPSELQSLLASLSEQLEELKKDGLKKDQEIQALSEMLEQQALHEAANPEIVPQETTQIQQPSSVPVPENLNTGVYRPNTHTVALNPRDVLAQNQMSGQFQNQQTSLQANMTQSQTIQGTNTSLSGVGSQPTTGPMETLMIAFLLTAIAVLGFGIFRNIKN